MRAGRAKGSNLLPPLLLLLLTALAAPLAAAAPDPELLQRAGQVTPDLLKDLEALVNIDSPSRHGPGSEKIALLLSEKLQALGGKVEVLAGPRGGGRNLLAAFDGTGKARILLLAHSDTVFKAGTAAARPFRISEGKALGPGVADNKGGIVAGLYALRLLAERNWRDYGRVTFLINCDEEIGSPSSRELILRLAREHDFALCLEPGRAGDGVPGWRKGTGRITVEVRGRPSHAGGAPEQGVNALMELAHQVLQLKKLEDREKGTTINFTVFQSGDRLNVIPDLAVARADMRARHPEEFSRVEEAGREMVRNQWHPDSRVEFTLSPGRPAFLTNEKTDALIARAREIYREIGRTLKVTGSGGASDGSYTALAGTPTLDGMGLTGGKAHTPEEYLQVDLIPPRLYLLARLLMELGARETPLEKTPEPGPGRGGRN